MKTMLQEHKKMKLEIDKLKTEATHVRGMLEGIDEDIIYVANSLINTILIIKKNINTSPTVDEQLEKEWNELVHAVHDAAQRLQPELR